MSEWMPGDAEAAAAVQAMEEIYGRKEQTGLAITPDVCRRDGMDRVYFSRKHGDRIRVVVLQRVGDDGMDPSSRRWNVADAFAVCIWGERDPKPAVRPQRVGPLDELARMAEMWCRLGQWR